jgi:hypothetical protein
MENPDDGTERHHMKNVMKNVMSGKCDAKEK